MSTNKRKEAAALFELIDKSTLKVPKHAGALKIPSWWSSKTNPAPTAPPPPAMLPATSESPASTSAPSATGPKIGHYVPPESSQTRLFEPPPADAVPASSPTIRAPAPQPSVQTPVRSAPPTAVSVPIASQREASDEPRIFAPQTYDPATLARRQWMGQQKQRVSRIPPWVLIGGAASVGVLLILLLWAMLHGKSKLETAGNMDLGSHQNSTIAIVRNPSQPLTPGTTVPPPAGLLPRPEPRAEEPQVEAGEPGKVYEPSAVARDPKLFYVVIAQTPSKSVVERNAKFLAEHGIDVSIEVRSKGNARNYVLVSVKGFASKTEPAAEAYREKIVQVGHLHPDFAKTRKAWDDAFLTHVTAPGTGK